jgi:hypothetical protein
MPQKPLFWFYTHLDVQNHTMCEATHFAAGKFNKTLAQFTSNVSLRFLHGLTSSLF